MSYLAAGVIAFGMFLLYDLNSFTWKNRILHTFFLIGNVILLASTAACFVTLIRAYGAPVWRIVIFGALAVSQAALLIYTLFFALPFEKTYTRLEENPPVYTEGVYSLCRHPGGVWFFFLYLFLALLTGQRLMMAVCICYSGLNVLYVWFQDRVTFKRTLSGYEAYQRETPFLIPTGKSVRKCAGYFRTMEEDGDEI